MYTIKLNNGTTLTDLVLNGNNFISNEIISNDVFSDNLNTIEISDGENAHTYHDMVLVTNRIIDGKSWFILAEKTLEQKEKEELEATTTDLQLALVEMYESIVGGA